MSIPDFQSLLLPVLKLFADGQTSIKECIPHLIEDFEITPEEVSETLQSGQTVLYNRAHWARTYLGKAGLLESPRRGYHRITDKGLRLLETNPTQLNVKKLKEIDSFRDWTEQGPSNEKSSKPVAPEALDDDQTPEDAIQAAHKIINAALRDDLISALLQVDPIRFERLILDLLQAMGFGRGRSDFANLTPASGDGGIDGVINEDALGLDAVYVQAKRYAPENKVSRPDIQRFVGSLTGESATKGVFVTTSNFSKEALAFVDRIQQRVVLINGQRLAQLMIEHDIGVRTRSVFKIKSLDDDYFSDMT